MMTLCVKGGRESRWGGEGRRKELSTAKIDILRYGSGRLSLPVSACAVSDKGVGNLVASGVNVRTSIHVTARSYTYMANEINRVFLEAITRNGLDPSDFTSIQDVIENGLRTWLTLRQLEVAYLEIYEPLTGKVRTRIDLNIEYQDAADEYYSTEIDKIKAEIGNGGRFPGCKYRVVVTTKQGAAEISGWGATTLGDVGHLTRKDVGSVINTSAAGAFMSIFS